MGEMEPPETFSLQLRGYQKQALLYVLYLPGWLNTNLILYQLDALPRNR